MTNSPLPPLTVPAGTQTVDRDQPLDVYSTDGKTALLIKFADTFIYSNFAISHEVVHIHIFC